MSLKTARESRGLSLREVADRIGKSHTTVWRWEEQGWVPQEYAEEVAEVLDCGVDDITIFSNGSNGTHKPEPNGEKLVRSSRELMDWFAMLYRSSEPAEVRYLLSAVSTFMNRDLWICFVSRTALNEECGLSMEEIDPWWDRLMASDFVTRVGAAEYAFRMKIPAKGGE